MHATNIGIAVRISLVQGFDFVISFVVGLGRLHLSNNCLPVVVRHSIRGVAALDLPQPSIVAARPGEAEGDSDQTVRGLLHFGV